jgi:hypothetical protein
VLDTDWSLHLLDAIVTPANEEGNVYGKLNVVPFTVNLWDLGPPESLRAVYANETYLKTTRKPSLQFTLLNCIR